ncbi:hypothetical protein [Hoeflea sp.]|uniref:hypothetical protein n=1 Tax=Hoeflea sp. TaxID=1940281 RepID=UPI003BAF08CF
MTGIDINRLLMLLGVIAIVIIAAFTNYRVEISPAGLKFEKNVAPAESRAVLPPKPEVDEG